jgi:hypothetical protein
MSKLREVFNTMIMLPVNILCIQKTKSKGPKTKVGRYRLQAMAHKHSDY